MSRRPHTDWTMEERLEALELALRALERFILPLNIACLPCPGDEDGKPCTLVAGHRPPCSSGAGWFLVDTREETTQRVTESAEETPPRFLRVWAHNYREAIHVGRVRILELAGEKPEAPR